MSKPEITSALARLRSTADALTLGWPPIALERIAGSGPDAVTLQGGRIFEGLSFEPGSTVQLRSDLELPASVSGIPITGDALEVTVTSLFPMRVRSGGREVFSDDGPPVAAGPALFTLVDSIREGANGPLEVDISFPDNQISRWLYWTLTTPRLRARFEALDTAWAQLHLASALASSDDDVEAVVKAALMVPDDLSSAGVEASLGAVADALAPFAERTAAIDVHVIGHSHIDMNWMWTWPDTRAVILRDMKSVLNLMDEFPELTFTHSQPATYEVVRTDAPELFERILGHVRSGRWEPATMQWVEGDVNMASGESQARQILEAVTWTRDVLGVSPSTFHAPDTFGHAGNIPQLAASAGAKRYYHHRGNPGGHGRWPAYWWTGDDGSRVLGMSTASYNGEITAGALAIAAVEAARHGLPASLLFHGIGDHGGGPSRHNLQSLRRFQSTAGLPSARCSSLEAYADQIISSGVALPEHRGESTTIFEGCYTTHADTKLYNRAGENLLTMADTLAALARVPSDLTEPWRRILFNQFHDIFDGSAIHEAYVANKEDFEFAASAASRTIEASLDVLQAGRDGIVVTNPLGWDRTDVVVVSGVQGDGAVWLRSESGERTPGQFVDGDLCFVATVPAFGSMGYRIEGAFDGEPGISVQRANGTGRTTGLFGAPNVEDPYERVETSTFVAFVRRDCGIITSLVDKRGGRELVAYGMKRPSDYSDSARPDLALNVLQILDEHPHPMSSWHLDEIHTEHSLLRGATTEVVESGPVRVVLEVRHTVRSSAIRQRITFYADVPRIDFTVDLDWQEIGNGQAGVPNLKAAFTANTLGCEAWYETPFAAVRRPANGQEVPALRWGWVGDDDYGIAVLNDSKHGYDALGNRLRLSLVRSGYEPDTISDAGEHEIRYALFPGAGSWRDAGVVAEAAAFNQPLLGRVRTGVDPPAMPLAPRISGAAVAGLKRGLDGGLVVRLYESAGRTTHARIDGLEPGAKIVETNLVEDVIGPVGSELTFRPWQVRTLRIDT